MNYFVLLESGVLEKSSQHDEKFIFALWTHCEKNCCKCLVEI